MSTQDAKKTGNSHSNLLDQLLKAADNAAPKTKKSTFSESCIKIASETPPDLKETLQKMAGENEKQKSMRKQAQMELDMPPVSNEPDFDEMAGAPDVSDSPLEEPADEAGADLEEAKQSLADAFVALCGSVENAIECLQTSKEPEMDETEEFDEFDESPLDSTPEDDLATNDVIPNDMLQSEPMPKPMEAPEMQQPFPR